MEEVKKRQQIPPFGSWNFCDEIPITQYFESAAIFFGGEGEDLFKVVKPTKLHHDYHNKKGKKGGVRREEGKKKPKRVDEDLYKVPPELLYQMPKRTTSVLVPKKKKLLWNFWTGCLGLNCICLKEL
ncbi:uncharacterized protein [Typha latifolia]|uniref:uncharacterized protein isoform X2 n=1 Tax=Typha latifolia TaxID=4733 RepID=UPI003C2B9C34